jgi:hypothetical protein
MDKGTYEDCRRESYARRVVARYLERYAPAELRNLGTEELSDREAEKRGLGGRGSVPQFLSSACSWPRLKPHYEALARLHHGGPRGTETPASKRYGGQVIAVMEGRR